MVSVSCVCFLQFILVCYSFSCEANRGFVRVCPKISQRKIRFRYLPPSRHRIMPVRVLENVAVSQTVLGNYPFILIVHHFSSCCKLSKKLKLLLHFVFFSDFWLVGMFGFYLILTLCVLLFLNAAVEFFMYFLMVSVQVQMLGVVHFNLVVFCVLGRYFPMFLFIIFDLLDFVWILK